MGRLFIWESAEDTDDRGVDGTPGYLTAKSVTANCPTDDADSVSKLDMAMCGQFQPRLRPVADLSRGTSCYG